MQKWLDHVQLFSSVALDTLHFTPAPHPSTLLFSILTSRPRPVCVWVKPALGSSDFGVHLCFLKVCTHWLCLYFLPEPSSSSRGWPVMATSIAALCLPACSFEILWLPLFDDNFPCLEGIRAKYQFSIRTRSSGSPPYLLSFVLMVYLICFAGFVDE